MAWTNPNNVTVLDGHYATAVADAVTFKTDVLFVTGFGFSVPADQVVSGIVVKVVGNATQTATPIMTVSLTLDAATIVGTSRVIIPTATDTTMTAGTSFDLFGSAAVTPSQANAGTFGVVIQGNGQTAGGDVFSVDYVSMTLSLATAGLTATPTGSGNVTLSVGRQYTTVFWNSKSKHYSDIAAFSTTTGPQTATTIVLTDIPKSPDVQVDQVVVLATADGGDQETLYYVVALPNGTSTYTDNTDEETLLFNNIFAQVNDSGDDIGVLNNNPPPQTGRFPTKHRGRIYMAVSPRRLYYSKSEDELLTSTGIVVGKFEEAWPPLNYFDVSESGETISGLLSDGTVLYIGTEQRVIRLFGDGPQTFTEPQTLFTHVGVLNQDVWKMVFLQGNPLGAVWLSPDLHVFGSDFNTYQDVGQPIQDILDSINMDVVRDVAWASYASQGTFSFYILAVPTGSSFMADTMLVLDLKSRAWFVWKPNDAMAGGNFFVTTAGQPALLTVGYLNSFVYQWTPFGVVDGVNPLLPGNTTNFNRVIPIECRTSWQDLTDASARKSLNEIEVITGSPSLLVSIDGASTEAGFAAPHSVVSNTALSMKPRGEYFVPLAGRQTRDRFYRYKFTDASQTLDVLRGLNVEGFVVNRT